MNRILFVDDEPEWVTDYIEELEKSFRVDFCQTAEESVEKLKGNDVYQAIVLDVQMPPPKHLSPLSTNMGVDTGLWVLGQARENIAKNSLPIILLTNRNPEVVKSGVQRLGLSGQRIQIREKRSTPYEKLPKLVDDMLPHLVPAEATLARIWPDNSGAVSVNSDRIGWLEFDVPANDIPKEAKIGDRIEVILKIDPFNKPVSCRIPASASVTRLKAGESFGERLTKDVPKLPQNLDDMEAMASYDKALASWMKSAGLK